MEQDQGRLVTTTAQIVCADAVADNVACLPHAHGQQRSPQLTNGEDGMTDRVPAWSESPGVDAQVEALLQQFSLEEKIDLVSGNLVVADDTHPSPPPSRIPPFSLSDGPAGVRGPGLHQTLPCQ